MTPLEVLTRNYRTAFLAYLSQREEEALHRGYELGRSAVAEGLGLLDLARVHHEVLLEVLRQTPAEDLAGVSTAAAEFLMEVLATPEMARRRFLESADTGETRARPATGGGRPTGRVRSAMKMPRPPPDDAAARGRGRLHRWTRCPA